MPFISKTQYKLFKVAFLVFCLGIAQFSVYYVVGRKLINAFPSKSKAIFRKAAPVCVGCCRRNSNIKQVRNSAMGLQQTAKNYGNELDDLAKQFNLPAPYLKALVTLECSGMKRFNPRFERHVCLRLKQVKAGKHGKYEHVTKRHLSDATDEAIENLATSWGPFQIMGYKCVELDIKIKHLRGDSALYWGVKWIDEEYGNYLRQGRFKDAFHLHNAGTTFPRNGRPRTYDPNYVRNGLKYIDYFD